MDSMSQSTDKLKNLTKHLLVVDDLANINFFSLNIYEL